MENDSQDMTSFQSGRSSRPARTLTASVLAVTLIFLARAAPAQPDTPSSVDLGDNAALKYWIAFGTMPNLTPQEEELISKWKESPIDEAAIAVIKKSENCLDILRQAAQVRRCDWGLLKDGTATLMPHLSKARQAARLACLRVKYRAHKGDGEGEVSDLLSVFALSRHVNSDGITIGFLVQCSLEKMATDAAAGCLTGLDFEQLRKLAAGLDALPERKGFREAILSEQADAKWWADRINTMDGQTKENTVKMMLMVNESEEGFTNVIGALAGDETSRARAEKAWAERKVTPEELSQYTRGFDKAQEHYKAFAEMGSLPLPEFDRETKVIQEKMKTDCPFAARCVFGSLPRLRYEDAESEVRMAMLKAAIAVVLGGPDHIKEFKDPFGDGPFEYSKRKEGFELKSKLTVNDKSVTLIFSALP